MERSSLHESDETLIHQYKTELKNARDVQFLWKIISIRSGHALEDVRELMRDGSTYRRMLMADEAERLGPLDTVIDRFPVPSLNSE
jgi:hypothetical protein